MKIPRIKLKKGKGWEDYITDNELDFWDMTFDAVNILSDNPDLDSYTAFILHGGILDKDKEFVIERNNISEFIENGLEKMENLEEYERCSRILEISKKFTNK